MYVEYTKMLVLVVEIGGINIQFRLDELDMKFILLEYGAKRWYLLSNDYKLTVWSTFANDIGTMYDALKLGIIKYYEV